VFDAPCSLPTFVSTQVLFTRYDDTVHIHSLLLAPSIDLFPRRYCLHAPGPCVKLPLEQSLFSNTRRCSPSRRCRYLQLCLWTHRLSVDRLLSNCRSCSAPSTSAPSTRIFDRLPGRTSTLLISTFCDASAVTKEPAHIVKIHRSTTIHRAKGQNIFGLHVVLPACKSFAFFDAAPGCAHSSLLAFTSIDIELHILSRSQTRHLSVRHQHQPTSIYRDTHVSLPSPPEGGATVCPQQ